MKRCIFLFGIVLLSYSFLFSQENFTSDLFHSIQSKRKGLNQANDGVLFKEAQGKPSEFLTELDKYAGDTMASIRFYLLDLYRTVGTCSSDRKIRSRVVSKLVFFCKDEDSGNSGFAINSLFSFRKSDFTKITLDTIRSILKEGSGHFDEFVRLVGYLDMTDQIPELQNWLAKSERNKPLKWSLLLSLSRLNDTVATNYILMRIQKVQVDDRMIYGLAPDLIYTHNRAIYDYLLGILYSDEKNCQSSNPNINSSIPCAYRIMELLVPVIDAIPLKARASGDIVTSNYLLALNQTRSWFNERRGSYKIKMDNE
jgi:hypothetical protein